MATTTTAKKQKPPCNNSLFLLDFLFLVSVFILKGKKKQGKDRKVVLFVTLQFKDRYLYGSKKNQLKLKTEKREEEGQEVAGDISSNNFNQLILIAIPSAITATTAAAAVNRYYG